MSYVTRCVCFGTDFEEMKALAEEHGCQTLEDLQEHVDFGGACQMCVPYVQALLRTGKTEFHWKDMLRKTEDG